MNLRRAFASEVFYIMHSVQNLFNINFLLRETNASNPLFSRQTEAETSRSSDMIQVICKSVSHFQYILSSHFICSVCLLESWKVVALSCSVNKQAINAYHNVDGTSFSSVSNLLIQNKRIV